MTMQVLLFLLLFEVCVRVRSRQIRSEAKIQMPPVDQQQIKENRLLR